MLARHSDHLHAELEDCSLLPVISEEKNCAFIRLNNLFAQKEVLLTLSDTLVHVIGR